MVVKADDNLAACLPLVSPINQLLNYTEIDLVDLQCFGVEVINLLCTPTPTEVPR